MPKKKKKSQSTIYLLMWYQSSKIKLELQEDSNILISTTSELSVSYNTITSLKYFSQDVKLRNSSVRHPQSPTRTHGLYPLNPQKYPQTETLNFTRRVRYDILYSTRFLRHILQYCVRNRLTKPFFFFFCYTLQSCLFLYLCWLLFNNFCNSCKTANKEILLSIEPKLGLQIVILSSYWEVKEIRFWSWIETKSEASNSLHTRCSSQNAQKGTYPKWV